MKTETGSRTVSVYNSAGVLLRLVEELEAVLAGYSSTFEVILVNEASPDQSWKVITELVREHGWIHGINLMRNAGQHNALLCGIRAAKCEIVTTIDDLSLHLWEMGRKRDGKEGDCPVTESASDRVIRLPF